MKAHALQSADQPASLIDVPTPEHDADGVRVAVRAASVNGFDVYQANGYLFGMMEQILPATVGRDFSGVVESVGTSVDRVAVGDEVLGFIPSAPPLHSGSFAETVAGGPELVLAPKPAGLSFEAAAALPLAGSAALDLLSAIDATAGDLVLVVGATGGVGSLVTQLATRAGLVVIATAKPAEDAFVRGLGASETIDYTAGSVADAVRAAHPDGIAAIIDLVDQQDALTALSVVVRSGGHVATLLGAIDGDALAANGITGVAVLAAPTTEKLTLLAGLAASGEIRVPIQATFPLDGVAEALATFGQGTLGKVVITV